MKTNNLLRSKWSVIFVCTFAFVLFFHFGSSKVLAADSNTAAPVTSKTLNVSGDGEVTVTPDTAYLSLGVLTEKPSASEAEASNSVSMNNVIAAIKNQGVKVEDIKTSNYSVNPKYDYDKTTGLSVLTGYTVSHTLTVTVRDINKVGQILDMSAKNGANVSNGISFGVSDYEKYYNSALINALTNAQSKAKAISGFLNIPLTMPVKITENSSGVPIVYPYMTDGKSASENLSVSTPIQAGTYKIKASVSLVYEY